VVTPGLSLLLARNETGRVEQKPKPVKEEGNRKALQEEEKASSIFLRGC
jgi:hypothetical protein